MTDGRFDVILDVPITNEFLIVNDDECDVIDKFSLPILIVIMHHDNFHLLLFPIFCHI